jgi:hypothetical protein
MRSKTALLFFNLAVMYAAAAGAQAETLYGFYPSPPEITMESVLATYRDMGQHGSVVLMSRNVPWKDFAAGEGADSADIRDIAGQVQLARANNLEPIFLVDPLNGLDRKRFMALPAGWTPSFANHSIRAAMTNYTMRILREFHPRFLALGSEINTYQDAHPEDYPSYLTLYREIYDRVKAVSPQTQVFATFQWDELNNLIPGLDGGKDPYETRWEQVEAFEPRLDLWAISTYPYFVYRSAREIPLDYYARLAGRTGKPLAMAECGYTAQKVGNVRGTPRDQEMFLTAVHDQLGSRLRLWIYTVLRDFSLASYASVMKRQGTGGDIQTLGWFAHIGLRAADGTPRPGLAAWDGFRGR